jgi:hypothetical protein
MTCLDRWYVACRGETMLSIWNFSSTVGVDRSSPSCILLQGACLYITRHANRAMAASFGSKPLSFFCRMRYSYLTFQGTCYSHSRKIVIFMDACSLALWSHIQVVLNAIWIFLEKQSYKLFCTIDLMISFGHPLAFFRGYCLAIWCKELSEISTAVLEVNVNTYSGISLGNMLLCLL